MLKGKKIGALICAAALLATFTVPAFASTGDFKFSMGWGQGSAFNSFGFTSKDSDGEPNFYVTPTNNGWNPNYDSPHVYAINTRSQECNRDNSANQLMGNYKHKIPYYSQSVPSSGQQMNLELKEFASGIHGYTIEGRWTP